MLRAALIFSNEWIRIQNFGKESKVRVLVPFNRLSLVMNLGKRNDLQSSIDKTLPLLVIHFVIFYPYYETPIIRKVSIAWFSLPTV
jgi:hypothetical protein